jgi:hypothetical protein
LGLPDVAIGPIIPYPVPFGLEGGSSEGELGIVVFNRADSIPIELNPNEVWPREGQRELDLLGLAMDSARCSGERAGLLSPVVLNPGGVVLICFEAPSPQRNRLDLDLDLGGGRSTVRLQRDRGTFFFVLE